MSNHRIRSTSDTDLAARHDREPWVDRNGDRYAHPRLTGASLSFAPRVECIPSRDPEPWTPLGMYGPRRAEKRPGDRFDPRLEYARPEPNPILVAFREDRHDFGLAYWLDVVRRAVDFGDPVLVSIGVSVDATPAEIEDARKVLTRLVEAFG